MPEGGRRRAGASPFRSARRAPRSHAGGGGAGKGPGGTCQAGLRSGRARHSAGAGTPCRGCRRRQEIGRRARPVDTPEPASCRRRTDPARLREPGARAAPACAAGLDRTAATGAAIAGRKACARPGRARARPARRCRAAGPGDPFRRASAGPSGALRLAADVCRGAGPARTPRPRRSRTPTPRIPPPPAAFRETRECGRPQGRNPRRGSP
jgi:hypothetical protein